MMPSLKPAPNAVLLFADGTVFFGYGIGAEGATAGEICFNTAMTGYQEILTDPSYTGQIVTFTAPHIGNVGTNDEDHEAEVPRVAGLIVREAITDPSSFRSASHLNQWLKTHGLRGISGVDSRAITHHIRVHGAQNVAIAYQLQGDKALLIQKAKAALAAAPDMAGLELAAHVTTQQAFEWAQPRWSLTAQAAQSGASHHVVAVDFGVKQNILRCLVSAGCRVTVVPATATAEEILALGPDGVFLSNGPGDPAATAQYALPTIAKLIESGKPMFGICLGHQLLGLAMGAKTMKMKQGHRGANHPVKDLTTGKVEITSQNHGFAVSDEALPADIEITHRSLFDNTVQGIAHKTKPIFSVQGHPEASPGPHDSNYLFTRFVEMMGSPKKRAA